MIDTPNDPSKPRTYFFIVSMRIERYYSSVMEEQSPLSDEALKLLEKQDYVGFFQACGSSYIRSIRRAQEVTAIIQFEAYRQKLAQEFATILKSSANVNKRFVQKVSKAKFFPLVDSLEMRVVAYGLTLNKEGAGSLVPNSLEEFSEVMKYSYEVMAKSQTPRNEQLGMVYGVELVPWTDSVSFQVAAKVTEEVLTTQVPRSLIEKAWHKSYDKFNVDFSDKIKSEFSCKKDNHHVDKFGYCCELASLYNPEKRVYVNERCSTCICRPSRPLEKSMVKSNMSNNGEFVSRLDSSWRKKSNQLSHLEKCITAVLSIPVSQDYNILKPRDRAVFAENLNSFTVRQLKRALDPRSDYSFLKHMSIELDEYTEMFYRRCISSMYGGGTSDVDALQFMSVSWQEHENCMKMDCLRENQRWNRQPGGGCVSGLMLGEFAESYSDEFDGEGLCSLDSDSYESVSCKYNSADLSTFYTRATRCWRRMIPKLPIYDIVDQFCMPVVTSEVVSDSDRKKLEEDEATYCLESEEYGRL